MDCSLNVCSVFIIHLYFHSWWASYEQAKASFVSDHLAVQSLCNHLSVHDWDVYKEKQDYKEIVHEAQKSEKCFGEDVERRGQVGEGTNEAEKNSDSEHPEEAAHGKHLPEGMTQQGGHVPQPVHKLRNSKERER